VTAQNVKQAERERKPRSLPLNRWGGNLPARRGTVGSRAPCSVAPPTGQLL